MKTCPLSGRGSGSISWQTEQILGETDVASTQECPGAVPAVSPQREQLFGFVHVAPIQKCPGAVPSVFPQREQVLGSLHVASIHSCLHLQPTNASSTNRAIKPSGTLFYHSVNAAHTFYSLKGCKA
jgi:hypothetical protein